MQDEPTDLGQRAIAGRAGWQSLRPLWGVLREASVALAAVAAYFLVRGATESSEAHAVANARQLLRFEQWLGIAWEKQLQELIYGHTLVEGFFSAVYIWGHWPVIAILGFWLFFYHRPHYYVLRNAFLISGAIGLVIFLVYPVAPPRLAGLGFLDTVTIHSKAYRVLQPPAFVNQYAAMPSLHFGWNLLAGGALVFRSSHWVLRLLGVTLTVLMLCAIVFTANHFIIDAVAGAAVALFGLALTLWLRRAPLPPRLGRLLWGDTATATAPLHMLEPGM